MARNNSHVIDMENIDWAKFPVPDLRNECERRNLPSQGSKRELVRLLDPNADLGLEEYASQDDLEPHDSASQTGSRVSQASRMELEAGARRAELMAQLEVNRKIREREMELQDLRARSELEGVKAREEYLARIRRVEAGLVAVPPRQENERA